MSRNVGLRAGGALWSSFAPSSPSSTFSAFRASGPLARLSHATPRQSAVASPIPTLQRWLHTRIPLHSLTTGGNTSTIGLQKSYASSGPFSGHPTTGSLLKLALKGFRRHIQSGGRRRLPNSRRDRYYVRNESSTAGKKTTSPTGQTPRAELSPGSQKAKDVGKATVGAAAASNLKYIRDRLPHLPHAIHAPTKEELLAAATGFWSRLRIHFKWFSIRSFRPWNLDDISAFFSWILVGHVLWIILGTTTFFSLAILTVNTVFAQETLARWIGNYLTQSSGLQVVFESAIVPKWKNGVISFKNVFVSRRPGKGKDSTVSKGSQEEAAAAAAQSKDTEIREVEQEDTNYTQFDLSIDTVNVTLSFTKWFNGKGLLKDVEVKGIRGVVDRTNLQPSKEYVDPRSYKHEHNPGDFELESFKMEDLLVTVYQPHSFRPFTVSIFTCDLPQLRKQWLFYDFLSANNVSGSFDNSLFTIHPRQTHNFNDSILPEVGEGTQWKKHSQVRIDGLNIDHLNRGVDGPFSWIHEGNVDIVADIMFPADDDGGIAKVMSDFYDRVEATVAATAASATTAAVKSEPRPEDYSLQHADEMSTSDDDNANATAPTPVPPTLTTPNTPSEDDNRFLVMDLRVELNDVRAAVPLFTRDLSYVNLTLIRPIVAYINSKRAFIPVNCRVVKRLSEFDGSWTIFDSGLMDEVSREMYEAFARDVSNAQARTRRMKKVGLWTIQLAAQALFLGLAGNIA